jgi:Fic family protein
MTDKRMPANHSLLEEIDAKQKKILENPDYYSLKRNRIESEGTKVVDLYSWWMEHPNERIRLLGLKEEDKKRKEVYRMAKEGVRRLGEAWNYALSVRTPFDAADIRQVGRLVYSGNANGYRTSPVHLQLDYTAPNYVKIPDLIERLVRDLNEGDLHTVEKAAMAHLNVAAIQPFADGNKRVARILQNRILVEDDFLPVVLPVGERTVYIDLLEDAMIGVRDGDLKKQRGFYDYIGCKVNVGLDNILDDLRF